jgi:hypothetical protein
MPKATRKAGTSSPKSTTTTTSGTRKPAARRKAASSTPAEQHVPESTEPNPRAAHRERMAAKEAMTKAVTESAKVPMEYSDFAKLDDALKAALITGLDADSNGGQSRNEVGEEYFDTFMDELVDGQMDLDIDSFIVALLVRRRNLILHATGDPEAHEEYSDFNGTGAGLFVKGMYEAFGLRATSDAWEAPKPAATSGSKDGPIFSVREVTDGEANPTEPAYRSVYEAINDGVGRGTRIAILYSRGNTNRRKYHGEMGTVLNVNRTTITAKLDSSGIKARVSPQLLFKVVDV